MGVGPGLSIAVAGHSAKTLVSSPKGVLGSIASEEEISDRSDSHEGDKRHSTPQPLDAVDLLRRAAVDVRERRRKQHELDDPRTTKGAFSLAVRSLQFLLRDMMITSMILPSFTCSCACSCMRNPLRSRVSVSQTRDGVSIRDTVPFRSGLGWAGSFRGQRRSSICGSRSSRGGA